MCVVPHLGLGVGVHFFTSQSKIGSSRDVILTN
jgi:hypothetical protein